MERDKRLWLLGCHDTLNSALRRIIYLENGAISNDYMMFDDGDKDCQHERDYLMCLQQAEEAVLSAFDSLEAICKRWGVIPDKRCPR